MENKDGSSIIKRILKKTKSFISHIWLSVVVIITILVIFNAVSYGITSMMLKEKLIEKQLTLQIISNQLDNIIKKDKDWIDAYRYYKDDIIADVELIDKVPMTYAAVFDKELQNLSARSPSYEGSLFMPERFFVFIEAIHSNEKGVVVLPFAPAGDKTRDMHVYFRWMPSDSSLDQRFLVVVAISEYTINTTISVWMEILIVALSAIVLLMGLYTWFKKKPPKIVIS